MSTNLGIVGQLVRFVVHCLIYKVQLQSQILVHFSFSVKRT